MVPQVMHTSVPPKVTLKVLPLQRPLGSRQRTHPGPPMAGRMRIPASGATGGSRVLIPSAGAERDRGLSRERDRSRTVELDIARTREVRDGPSEKRWKRERASPFSHRYYIIHTDI